MAVENPTILCLDTGTTMGWSIFKDGKIVSGRKGFPRLEHHGYGVRFLNFKKWLTDTKARLGSIDIIYFEGVSNHTGTQAAHVYGGFIATLAVFCEHHGIPYDEFGVGAIKKFFTGNGSAKKPDMIAECIKRGHDPKDDNEADAIAIMYLALKTNSLTPTNQP